MGWPQEYFSPFAATKLYQQSPSAVHGFDLVARFGVTSNGVAAVKFFPDHLDQMESRFWWPDWFPRVSWIWLTRADLLGQAISRAIAVQTGVWTAGDPPLGEPAYSAKDIEDSLLRIAEIDSRWRIYFACNAITPFHVLYEQLDATPGSVIRELAKFLGIEIGDTPISAMGFVRQRNETNDEWRRRYLAEAASPASPVGANLRRPPARTFRNLVRFLRGRLQA
jgi:LPS sulfotransferase NodH